MYTAQKLLRIRPNRSSLTSSSATVSSFSWSTLVGNKADALYKEMNTGNYKVCVYLSISTHVMIGPRVNALSIVNSKHMIIETNK